jgi:hypothetical protein
MGHSVEALIIPDALVASALVEIPHTRPLQLSQGLHIVPITDATLDALRERFPHVEEPAIPEFWKMSGPLGLIAERLSQSGPVAYIETEYFGGTGGQAATVWESGSVRMPPTQAEIGPINSALRLMGVRVGDALDEFDAVGLGANRSNDRWLGRAL